MSMRTLARRLTLAFLFTIPWETSVEFSGVGTVSRVLGLAAAAVWLLSALGRGRMRRPDALQIAFFAFLVWNGLTIYWSIDPASSISGFATSIQLLGMLVVLWDLFDTPQLVRSALQTFVLGAFVSIASIVGSFLSGQTSAYQRYSAPGFEVDVVALILALGIPAAWYLASRPAAAREVSPWVRAVNFLYVPAALFAMVLTGTRGAIVASVPALVLVVWSLVRSGHAKRFVALVIVLGAVVLVVAYAPTESIDRIASTTGELSGGGDLNGRAGIWQESFTAFLGRPIGGVGNDAHRAAIPTGKVAHNTLISVLVETGVVGFSIFAALLAAVVSRVRRCSGLERRYWLTQLTVLALGSMTLSTEDAKYFWLFVALAFASGTVAYRREAQPETRAAPVPAAEPLVGPSPV